MAGRRRRGNNRRGGTGGACVTSVSGTVYDPAGVLPLYNVSVYAPTRPLTPIAEGITCDRCGQPSGAPAAMALSNPEGSSHSQESPLA